MDYDAEFTEFPRDADMTFNLYCHIQTYINLIYEHKHDLCK